MNNEEKAQEICEKNKQFHVECSSLECYLSALEMAQWKDEQLDFVIDKVLQRNGDFLKQGKITQYGYDMAFATIKNIREYLKQ